MTDREKPDHGLSPGWRPIFPYDSPYTVQIDAINELIETSEQSGYGVIEGACGTGKTLIALSAAIDRVRDPDSDYERVFVVTSVKQQLRQFEQDLRTINANLPEEWRPVSGLTLVGKADVCPYARENRANIDDSNVYDRCEGLRERTRNLTGEGGPTSASVLAGEARSQQVGIADSGAAGADYLETAGEPTPYRPQTEEYGDTEYCPFYAQFLDDLPDDGDAIEAVPFDFTDRGLIDTDELVALSAGHGTCPHSMMGAVLSDVEVVVGNYYHAFDPTTAGSFTGALIDDSTFLVCDEAHMLEPRVRDLVSDGVGDETLRDAASELTRVAQAVQFDDPTAGRTSEDADLVGAELEDSDVSLDELVELRDFIEALREELDRRVKAHLDGERPGWRAELADLHDHELPLRDPEVPAPDEITEWADREGFGEGVWSRAEVVGSVVARILDEVEEEDVTRSAPAAGRLLNAWYRCDHESYFREIELERTWDESEPPDSWRRAYNARLALHNCVPSEAIGDRLAEFGGGVLMSATLEPLDVFREVTGLNHLEAEGRPVKSRTYGLGFSEANRASFAVDAPKFTYSNRGRPGEENECRRLHVDAAAEVARSPGNVLVGMPSYGEAEWMADELEATLDKPVLLDSSSTNEVTEELKAEFFRGDPKVLVTSIRGTLTEGVDYQGDRLAAAVVCGVPIINTASPRTRAVKTAYDREFGDGFETALTVPAVRKARQAIGRVIRGQEEVGIRAFVDARYARESWNSVRSFLPEPEREEFQPVSADMLGLGVDRFWNDR